MREEDDQLYIYRLYGISTPRRLRVGNTLRSKIGPNATITEDQIKSAQQAINNSPVNFKPYALKYIEQIERAVEEVSEIYYMPESNLNSVTIPMTEIKGQAGMFGNSLVSELSAKLLKFIEHYKRFDADVLAIVGIYCKSVRMSYESKLLTSDTSGGRVLLSEMEYAMERYNRKFKKLTGH